MHLFVTGATGWVGSAVVADLIGAGHQVTGLSRSANKAVALEAAGATALVGTLDDLDLLREAASRADAVAHLAFNHDFSKFAENAEQDRRAIEAMGGTLEGSDRPILVVSGLAGLPRSATEADVPPAASVRKSEAAAAALRARGVRAATVRFAPSVHEHGDYGFIPTLIAIARQSGVSAYPGDGENRWSGVFRQDAARVFRLALAQGVTEEVYHAVADEGVPFRDIAAVIGRNLGLPVESRPPEHFGWLARMAAGEMSATSAKTRAVLGWEPEGPSLLSDIDQPGYYAG